MRPLESTCFFWALAGHSAAALRVNVQSDASPSALSSARSLQRSNASSGAGMVGQFGKRGFRTLGGTCWDSSVWRQDYHLTRAMCAKTRSHRSSSGASERVLRKLHEGKCLVLVALGASMTFGNCYGCWHTHLPEQYERTWPAQLKKWLDTMFPCGGEGHQVHNFAQPAADANYWGMQVHVWKADPTHVLHKADMIFSDSAVTDVESRLGVWPPALVMPPQNTDLIMADNELLIRMLKSLANKPWILYTEVSWRYDKQRYKGDIHWDAVTTHLPVCQHYDIDQTTLLDAFLPFNDRKLMWMQAFFFIDGAHGSPYAHQLIAQVVAHTMMEESHYMNLPPAESEAQAGGAPEAEEGLPEPVWMDREVAMYYDNLPAYVLIPPELPFRQVFARSWFEWNGHQIIATNLTPGDWPTLHFWVNLSLAETNHVRPNVSRAYVNLGLRRLDVRGKCGIYYHVQESPCGGADDAGGFAVATLFEPYWPIATSLRYNEGFFVDLPNTTAPVVCLQMALQWYGQTGSDPYKFLLDDMTVLA